MSESPPSTLPLEILLKIIFLVKEKSTLKYVRQCCKAFDRAITPLLFDVLVAVPNRHILGGLKRLSANHQIRDSVHHIKLFPALLKIGKGSAVRAFTDLPDQSTWDRRRQHNYTCDCLQSIATGIYKRDDKFIVSSPLDQETGQTSSWDADFFDASHEVSSELIGLLQSYPRATRLSLTDEYFVHCPPSGATRWRFPAAYESMLKETMTKHGRSMFTLDRQDIGSHAFINGISTYGSSYFARCMLTATTICHNQVQHLVLDQIGPDTFFQPTLPGGTIHSPSFKVGLVSLQLTFNKDVRMARNTHGLQKLLSGSDALERLSIDFGVIFRAEPAVLLYLAKHQLRFSLTDLELQNFTVTASVLLSLLTRQANSLRSLSLAHVNLTDDPTSQRCSWVDIFRTLPQILTLHKICLDGWFYSSARQHVWQIKWHVTGSEDQCICTRLNKYITNDGEFPYELEDFARIARGKCLVPSWKCFGDRDQGSILFYGFRTKGDESWRMIVEFGDLDGMS